MTLEAGIDLVRNEIIEPLKKAGILVGPYSANLTGNADKLERTREAMSGNFLMAIIITYLLLAVLFQHWGFPLIILLSVPMAAAGGVFGLAILNLFVLQPLDVLLADQLAWLEALLDDQRDVRWTFVFVHQPLWDASEIHPDWLRVEEWLGDRQYTVFAGHYHAYTKHVRHDRSYLTLATTGHRP